MTPEPEARWVEAEAMRSALYDLAAIIRIDLPPKVDDGDLLYVLDLMRVLDGALAYLRELKADLGELAATLIPGREISVVGIGNVKVDGGYNRSAWDHDELFALLLARSRDEREADPETGEFEPHAEAFLRVLRDCMANPGYWKIGDADKGTGLKARGIDVDEFCVKAPKRKTVTLPSDTKLRLEDIEAPLAEILGDVK